MKVLWQIFGTIQRRGSHRSAALDSFWHFTAKNAEIRFSPVTHRVRQPGLVSLPLLLFVLHVVAFVCVCGRVQAGSFQVAWKNEAVPAASRAVCLVSDL